MMQSMVVILILFLSTLSLRRATFKLKIMYRAFRFLSTLSLRRATITGLGVGVYLETISIHALLAESDGLTQTDLANRAISIHALLAESDCQGQAGFAGYRNFYPRSPCGERQ